MTKFGLLFSIIILVSQLVCGQAIGDYRSNATTGNWGTLATWQMFNGTTWVAPASVPSSASGVITIRSGHIVSIVTSRTADQIVIDPGGQITITAPGTLTIADGDGTDLIVNGTVITIGTIIRNGTISFESGSIYRHQKNDGTIPTATWNANSTCLITGITSSLPSGMGQAFGHLTWDCAGQTTANKLGAIFTLNGNFTLLSTGTSEDGKLRLAAGTTDILGNYSQSGGRIILANEPAGTINVGGNFSLTGGTLTITDNAASTLNVAGNFTHTTGSTITEIGTSGNIVFNGSGIQNYTGSGTISETINFTVNSGAKLHLGTNLFGNGSSGTFTLSSGGTLGIGHADGISTTNGVGNVRVNGTKSYSVGANYIYNGTSAQVTGNGLPTTAITGNLTILNTAGVTLSASVTVNGTLNLTSGLLTLGSNNLTLGSSSTISGTPSATAMVVPTGSGELRKTFTAPGSFTFPVGDNTVTTEYSPVTLNFTSGSFSSAYAGVKLANSKHPNNTSVTHYINRYWTVSSSEISGFSCDASFTYVDADIVGTEANLYCGKWDGLGWTLLNAVDAGNNQLSGTVTSFSDFTGGESAPLPVELSSFSASIIGSAVKLNWRTETEINNYGFEIQKSQMSNVKSETEWEKIGFVEGYGNSNSPKDYSFTDARVLSGTYSYRLKQIDIDGQFEYSKTIEVNLGAPNKYELAQNFPNPFNPNTSIKFTLPETGYVKLTVYNMLGQEVVTLVNGVKEAGTHIISFNAAELNSGIYMYRIESNGFNEVRKMTLIK